MLQRTRSRRTRPRPGGVRPLRAGNLDVAEIVIGRKLGFRLKMAIALAASLELRESMFNRHGGVRDRFLRGREGGLRRSGNEHAHGHAGGNQGG